MMAMISPPVPSESTTAGVALLAAAAWGGGDFSGGMGVKAAGGTTTGALRIVAAGHAMSLPVLLLVLWLMGAGWPTGLASVWGLAAGVAAGLSLTAFYMALARGAMGASAAVSGLLAAAIPATVALWIDGAPSPLRLAGFGAAAVAIWLIAATPTGAGEGSRAARSTFPLAVAGGIGFGIYFVALRFANGLGVFEPMALARCGSLAVCGALLLCLRDGSAPRAEQRSGRTAGAFLSRQAWLWAGGVAVLDTGGNLLFIAATRTGRLDVAAVLASLYPASTILLAAVLLHERPGRRQWVGMAVAAAAVVMITV